MKINTQLLLITVLFMFLSFLPASLPVFAETMEDAWKAALSSNHQIQASQRNTVSSQLSLEAAKSARIPSLTLESGYTVLNNAPAAIISGAAIKDLPTGEDKYLSYKAMINMPIFTGGRISESIFSAGSGLNSAKQDEIKTIFDIKMRVSEAYVSVLRSKHLVEVTGNNVASLSAHTRDVTHFYEQGMITKNDLLASQVALADARQRSIQAMNNLNL
jgi:outer membrane protein